MTQKVGLKKLSLIRVYTPRFQPIGDLVKAGIQKVEFKSSLCIHIFHPVEDLENIGFKKLSLSRVYAPRFHPVDKWISTVEFKSRLSGVFTLTW